MCPGVVRVDDFHAGHVAVREPYFHQTKFQRDAIPEPTVEVNGKHVIRIGDETSCGDAAESLVGTSGFNVLIEDQEVNLVGNPTSGHGDEPGYPTSPSTFSVFGSSDVLIGETATGLLASSMGLSKSVIGGFRDFNDMVAQQILAERDANLEAGIDPDTTESVEQYGPDANQMGAPLGSGTGAVFDVKIKYNGGTDYSYHFFNETASTTEPRDMNGRVSGPIPRNIFHDNYEGSSLTKPTTGTGYQVDQKLYLAGRDLIEPSALSDISNPELHDAVITITKVLTYGTGARIRVRTRSEPNPDHDPSNPASEPNIYSYTVHIDDGGSGYKSGDIIKLGANYHVVEANESGALTGFADAARVRTGANPHTPTDAGAIYDARIDGEPSPIHPDHMNPANPASKHIMNFQKGEFKNVPESDPTPIGETNHYPDASSTTGLNFLPHTDARIIPELKDKLVAWVGRLPVDSTTITSAYRSPAYNKGVGGAKKSQHTLGRGADNIIPTARPNDPATGSPYTKQAYMELMLREALAAGFTGIGIYPNKNFFHLDVRTTGQAFWGPNGSRTSLPSWATEVINATV